MLCFLDNCANQQCDISVLGLTNQQTSYYPTYEENDTTYHLHLALYHCGPSVLVLHAQN